ncbi:hypothetical protein P7H98_12460 [Lactococcus lactis]|uniref:hypothetical protein n=1 Tax=Lactococcus lactis TaxID=1358 RepID=UPI00289050AB|nr:hypothetical protein [Lactococcus lactis]MDT2944177.1 hypothetical protein [Lactococcus lactis]
MFNWKQLFNRNERQDSQQDSQQDEWAEYTEGSLDKFMKGSFMSQFANDCSQSMKAEGREDYDYYPAIKQEMSSILMDFGYPPLHAMEDAYSEREQLRMLEEFKVKYLNSK